MSRLAMFLIGLLSAAQAQAQAPRLSDLAPIMATDASRTVNEMMALIKLAQAAEAKAAYWEDACRSTVQCGVTEDPRSPSQ